MRVCCAALLSAVCVDARADSRVASAELLFREGRALLEREAYAQACPKLEQSHRLDPALGTLLLLAFCHEKIGRTATAYAEYTRGATLAEQAGDSKKAAQSRRWAEALLPRLSTVQLDVDEPASGLRVQLGGSDVDQTQWGTRVVTDPGTQLLRAEAPRCEAYEIQISVPRNGNVVVRVPPLKPTPEGPDPDASPGQPTGFWQSSTPGWIAAGVGIVGVGVGSFFGLRAVSRNNDSDDFCNASNRCSDQGLALRDQALVDARISTVSMAVGVVGLAAGAVLLWPHVTGRTSVAPGSARVDLAVAF